MTIKHIFEMGLINDNTKVIIRDNEMHAISTGNWFQDNILKHVYDEVERFTWQDDNKFLIDVK